MHYIQINLIQPGETFNASKYNNYNIQSFYLCAVLRKTSQLKV